jgi:hypothetical protein
MIRIGRVVLAPVVVCIGLAAAPAARAAQDTVAFNQHGCETVEEQTSEGLLTVVTCIDGHGVSHITTQRDGDLVVVRNGDFDFSFTITLDGALVIHQSGSTDEHYADVSREGNVQLIHHDSEGSIINIDVAAGSQITCVIDFRFLFANGDFRFSEGGTDCTEVPYP